MILLKQLTQNIVSFSAYLTHCVCLDSEGIVWTWGNNSYGSLGDGTVIHRSSPVQIPGTQWNRVVTGEASFATKTKAPHSLKSESSRPSILGCEFEGFGVMRLRLRPKSDRFSSTWAFDNWMRLFWSASTSHSPLISSS